MNNSRKINTVINYVPCKVIENEEIYQNGIFHFNISRILEHIISGKIEVEKEEINVSDWYKTHFNGLIDEEHLYTVDTTKPVIQAEISPNRYVIIDGNHRLEKAYRNNIKTIDSYKLKVDQLLEYFTDIRGYESFVEYWNSKI
ncbi:MAG: ParB N-terminal domain-containing protein [Senegalia sp. (in: firmicutes)]|uniref:hypothetical protein n=1 Tax=Senegalia sp. (in: firmicutes) TaxID=1924098 RepID=UPI003F9CB472